jgi:hypothetical protein
MTAVELGGTRRFDEVIMMHVSTLKRLASSAKDNGQLPTKDRPCFEN